MDIPNSYFIPSRRDTANIGRDGSTPDERLGHAGHEAGRLGPDGKPTDAWRDQVISENNDNKRRAPNSR